MARSSTPRNRTITPNYGEVARSLYKYENNGEFTVDELIKLIPASLMAGIPNVAPAEEPR